MNDRKLFHYITHLLSIHFKICHLITIYKVFAFLSLKFEKCDRFAV